VATTFYKHDNKVIGFQNKVVSAPAAPSDFSVEVTTATTPQNFQIVLAGASSLKVTWGDTNEDTYTTDGLKTHSYATPGTYTITFVSGTATLISFGGDSGNNGTPALLTKVKTAIPASLGLTSSAYMFRYCVNVTSWAANFFDAASANVTNIDLMFIYNTTFNEPVNGWNTAKVTRAWGTFYDAESFNQPMSNWNTGLLDYAPYFLSNAYDFNQDLSAWNVTSLATADGFMEYCAFTTANYDALLISWGAQAVQSSVGFAATGTKYTAGGAAATARAHLVDIHGWTISDAGPV
jgi:hypothetical protein